MGFVFNEEHARNPSKLSAYNKPNSNKKDLGKVEERQNGSRF